MQLWDYSLGHILKRMHVKGGSQDNFKTIFFFAEGTHIQYNIPMIFWVAIVYCCVKTHTHFAAAL